MIEFVLNYLMIGVVFVVLLELLVQNLSQHHPELTDRWHEIELPERLFLIVIWPFGIWHLIQGWWSNRND